MHLSNQLTINVLVLLISTVYSVFTVWVEKVLIICMRLSLEFVLP